MNFDFIGKRKFAYALSCIIIIAGIVSLFVQGLNFGIDFTGGTVFQVQYEDNKEISDLRDELGTMGYDGAQIQQMDNGAFQIKTEFMDQTAQDEFEQQLKDASGSFEVLSTNAVGPSIGQEILLSGILALIVAVVLMVVYITIRFQWRFALAGNIALFHDILVTVSIFSIFQLEVNSNFVAAILTIFGYSINDTIVVFDRIREYLADQLDVEPEKITPDSDIINDFGADSLDVIDMITTLSDEFGVEIPDEDIETFHTVGDVVVYLEDRL